MRTIAIVNQKGGCGKTTTAINLASVFAKRSIRTLLVDMDPQAHCSVGFGVPESQIEYGLAEALLADHDETFDPESLMWECGRCLDLAPSTTRLAAMEAPTGGMHERPDRDRRLDSLLSRVRDHYDLCLIDCPPTIGLLTFNALRACREALIPVETGFFALRGAEKQWKTVQRTVERLNRPIRCHLLPTLHDPNSRNARDILTSLQRQFPNEIVPIAVREYETLREAASFGQPVAEYAPGSDAHRNFEMLADWLFEQQHRPDVNIEIMPEGRDKGTTERRDGVVGDIQSVSPSVPESPNPSRAAEMAERVRHIARTSALHDSDSLSPATRPDAFSTLDSHVTHLSEQHSTPHPQCDAAGDTQFGIVCEADCVRFVLPGDFGQSIALAGDFNGWSPNANRFTYRRETGVFELSAKLPPGRYEYRLIVDGRWLPDPYNAEQTLSPFGDPNSVLVVPEPAPKEGIHAQ